MNAPCGGEGYCGQLSAPLRKFCGSDFTADFIAESLLPWIIAGKSFDELYGMLENFFNVLLPTYILRLHNAASFCLKLIRRDVICPVLKTSGW